MPKPLCLRAVRVPSAGFLTVALFLQCHHLTPRVRFPRLNTALESQGVNL
jgi:hypothetical protein